MILNLLKYFPCVHSDKHWRPVGLCTLIHPGIEDCTNGSPKLCFWILWELLAKLQLDHGFVRLDQFFQVLWKQLTVLQGMISLKMKDEIEGRKVSGKRWKSYESREVSGHPKKSPRVHTKTKR